MKKRYFWKELTPDGRLLFPTVLYQLNNFRNGYDSEEEAVADYKAVNNLLLDFLPTSLVLITEYSVD